MLGLGAAAAGHQPLAAVGNEEARDHDEDRRRNREFNVQDANGAVCADISKTHAGLAKEMFSKGDNYVLSMTGPVNFSLRALAVASTLVIDTKFHQA